MRTAFDTATHELSEAHDRARLRIISAAADLLRQGGRDALTTRAVAAAAGVQGPTIYRLFGDKQGLLSAVAEHGFARYYAEKSSRRPHRDPVENLRSGWDLHVAFGLANPEIFALMYGDPQPGPRTSAAQAAHEHLSRHIRNIALAGRLRVGEERASEMVRASGCGTVLTLLTMPQEQRDGGLSKAAREAVIAAITTDTPVAESPGLPAIAAALRVRLPDVAQLSQPERLLLDEWLRRIS